MNWKAVVGIATLALARQFTGSKLKWKTVNEWITSHSNADEYRRGYSANQLGPAPSNSYVDLHKQPKGDGYVVTATVFFDRNQGAATSQTWKAKKLDSELEKVFGRNLRVRIQI